MSFDLAKRSTVRELCAVFASAEAEVRGAFATIAAAEQRLAASFALGSERLDFRIYASHCHHPFDADSVESAIARMRRDAWKTIVDRLEIRRAISIERERTLSKSLDEDEPLPLTEENVTALVQRFADDLPTLWKEAVREVFEWLRPRPDGWTAQRYKTVQRNQRFEIGTCIVITGATECSYGHTWSVGSHTRPRLLALDNVFSGLDGNGTIAKSYYGPLVDAIQATPRSVGRAQTDYFEVRLFKNRSMQLRFLRLDLLGELNRTAGGSRLRSKEGASCT